MSRKEESRLRRSRKLRAHVARLNETPRLSVHRTPRHIYAQIVSPKGDQVLVAASSISKDFAEKATGNIKAATAVGKLIAEKAKKAGIEAVAFDRGGFRYHGRVKALADAAREGGLEF